MHDWPLAVSICSDDFAYRAKIDPIIRGAFARFAVGELMDYRLCVGSFLTKRGGGSVAVAVHNDTSPERAKIPSPHECSIRSGWLNRMMRFSKPATSEAE